mgnify:FL=1|jgi:hypothetical protein
MHHYFFNEGKIISVELDQKDKNSVMVFVKFKHDTLSFSLKDLKQQFAKIVTLKASALPKYIVVKNAVAQNSTPFEDLVYPKKTVVPWLIERSRTEKKPRITTDPSSYSDDVRDAYEYNDYLNEINADFNEYQRELSKDPPEDSLCDWWGEYHKDD